MADLSRECALAVARSERDGRVDGDQDRAVCDEPTYRRGDVGKVRRARDQRTIVDYRCVEALSRPSHIDSSEHVQPARRVASARASLEAPTSANASVMVLRIKTTWAPGGTQ